MFTRADRQNKDLRHSVDENTAVFPVNDYGGPMPRSVPWTLRWVFSVIAAVLAVCLATLTLLLAWFQQSVGDESHFVSSADDVIQEESFRSDLADAATQQIMDSDSVQQYLGDGSTIGGLPGLQSWAKDRASGLMHSTVKGVVDSEDFRSTWKQTAKETHASNFGDDPSSTLVVDASPIYQSVNDKVENAVHIDLGLGDDTARIELEKAPSSGEEGPMAHFLHNAQSLAAVAPTFGAVAVVATLVSALAAPRGKSLFVALVAAAAGLVTWVSMTVLAARFHAQLDTVEGTGGLIAQHMGDALTSNVQAWALTSLGVGLGIALILVIIHVMNASRHANHSHTF